MDKGNKGKVFGEWSQDDLEFAFGVKKIMKSPPEMEEWVKRANAIILTEEERNYLKKLRDLADEDIDGWNETELREFLIVDLTKLVNFRLVEYQANRFMERYINVVYENIRLYGFVDWMVAKGKKQPYEPYFFIHVPIAIGNKHEKGTGNDPRGQLVATMLAAQTLNKKPPREDLFNTAPKHFYKDIPIYGIYLIGRMWFFVTLREKDYFISKVAIVTELEDLYFIVKMLKAQKQIIIQRLKAEF